MKTDICNAFHKIKADDALIMGTENYLKREIAKRAGKKHIFTPKKTLTALFACMAIFCFAIGLFSWQVYHTVETFVSVDVNPSIEFTLNRFDRVISAHSFNTDGDTLLNNVDIRGKKSDSALELLITEMERGGYITQEGLVSVTVQTANVQREQSICRLLQNTVEDVLQNYSPQPAIEVFSVTQEIQSHAHDHSMTPAKYLAILELMEVDEAASLDEYSDNSIGQIRQRTRECKQEHNYAENSERSHGHGHH